MVVASIVGRPCAVAFLFCSATAARTDGIPPRNNCSATGSCSGESVASSELRCVVVIGGSTGPAGRGGRAPRAGRSVRGPRAGRSPGVDDEASRSMGFLGGRLVRSVRVEGSRASAPSDGADPPSRRPGPLSLRPGLDSRRPGPPSRRLGPPSRRVSAPSRREPPRPFGAYVTTTSGPDFTVGMSSRRSLRGSTGEAVLGAITERISMPSMYCSTSAR